MFLFYILALEFDNLCYLCKILNPKKSYSIKRTHITSLKEEIELEVIVCHECALKYHPELVPKPFI